jgi:hypothetical protein
MWSKWAACSSSTCLTQRAPYVRATPGKISRNLLTGSTVREAMEQQNFDSVHRQYFVLGWSMPLPQDLLEDATVPDFTYNDDTCMAIPGTS